VKSTGSIPVKLGVTQTTPIAPFASILTAPVPDVTLNQSETHDYVAGLQWPELTNASLGKRVSISYTVSCVEAGASPSPTVTTSPIPTAMGPTPTPVIVGGDWLQFRNGPTHTGYNPNETTISASNVAGLGVAWTATTGGVIYSSPAVANGVVYVGSGDHKLYAYAVGCASGGGSCSPLWTATTGSYITSGPAVANGVVYVGSEDGKLYAYAVGCASGGGTCTPLWTATTGGVIYYSSPAVANGVVYVGSEDGKLYAYSLP
jgi:outer membrane protein assembly factor BamB